MTSSATSPLSFLQNKTIIEIKNNIVTQSVRVNCIMLFILPTTHAPLKTVSTQHLAPQMRLTVVIGCKISAHC